jgi:DNA-binding NtrC family response regulator
MALIIVIEEERDSCGLIQRVFERHGHRVVCFVEMSEARIWLEKNSPNLAIVSAGKYGEKANDILCMLKKTGIEGGDIVLRVPESSIGTIRKNFKGDVRDILIKTSDVEGLEEIARQGP